jgi:hypothetical protein
LASCGNVLILSRIRQQGCVKQNPLTIRGNIAAKLAVGYLLDELKNDITREPPASFEPVV